MNNIKALRKACGLSQKELTAKLGVSQSTISDWESGTKNPSTKRAERIADLFGVTIDDIYRVNKSVKPDTAAREVQIPRDIVELFSAWNTISAKGKQIVVEVLNMARRCFPIEFAPLPQKELDMLRDALDAATDNATDAEQIGLFETGHTEN